MNESKALAILGLPRKETLTEAGLKAAFLRANFRTHPDRGGTAAAFIEAKAAYDFLKGRVNSPSFSDVRQHQRGYYFFDVDKFVSDFWNEKVKSGKAKHGEEVFHSFVRLLLAAHRQTNGTLLTKKMLMEMCEMALFSTNASLK